MASGEELLTGGSPVQAAARNSVAARIHFMEAGPLQARDQRAVFAL
jgi:hypothetical protein